MRWESTDQFGNMFIGVSESTDVASFEPDFGSLLDELAARQQGDVVVTVDFGYGGVNGPDPDAVSHVLQVPWLCDCDQDAVLSTLTDWLANKGLPGFALCRS